MIIPKTLKRGDTIGIVSPSNILYEKEDIEKLNESISLMEDAGFRIKVGKYAFANETGYGTKAIHKAEDINRMFKDSKVKAIFSITGGNDCNSTFDYLDYNLIKENPKIICGFSDTTSILNVITEKTGLITYLGPSMKSISSGETEYRYRAVIDRFVEGKTNLAEPEDLDEFKVIREGKAQGELIGGNLSLTEDLILGKYKVNFKNKILCLEDLGFESPAALVNHNIYTLKQNGIFDQISGIWLGNYEADAKLEDILLNALEDIEFNKPIIKSENFGHSEKKIVIPIGTKAKIDTKSKAPYIELLENCID